MESQDRPAFHVLDRCPTYADTGRQGPLVNIPEQDEHETYFKDPYHVVLGMARRYLETVTVLLTVMVLFMGCGDNNNNYNTLPSATPITSPLATPQALPLSTIPSPTVSLSPTPTPTSTPLPQIEPSVEPSLKPIPSPTPLTTQAPSDVPTANYSIEELKRAIATCTWQGTPVSEFDCLQIQGTVRMGYDPRYALAENVGVKNLFPIEECTKKGLKPGLCRILNTGVENKIQAHAIVWPREQTISDRIPAIMKEWETFPVFVILTDIGVFSLNDYIEEYERQEGKKPDITNGKYQAETLDVNSEYWSIIKSLPDVKHVYKIWATGVEVVGSKRTVEELDKLPFVSSIGPQDCNLEYKNKNKPFTWCWKRGRGARRPEEWYVFTWDYIPGTSASEKKLWDHLFTDYKYDWLKGHLSDDIEKTTDGKHIIISDSDHENWLNFTLYDNNTVVLINDGLPKFYRHYRVKGNGTKKIYAVRT